MSVDIIGSTEYKAKNTERNNDKNGEQSWLAFFETFYQDYPEKLNTALTKIGVSTLPQPWKSLGDEIIFQVEVNSHKDIADYLFAFMNASDSAEKYYASKELPIKVKMAAWLAGFPKINAIVNIKNQISEEPDSRFEDYLGPSMDTGFRLKQHATHTRMPISVEIAYVLSSETSFSKPELAKESYFELFFSGEKELKGVLKGIPYPLFYIRRNSEKESLLQKLTKTEKVDLVDVRKYCEHFISEVNDPLVLCKPYFMNDKDPDWQKMPAEHTRENSSSKSSEMNLHLDENENSKGDPDLTSEPIQNLIPSPETLE
ncbi:hypothetical protein EHQ43_10050 [Leptospira bouyouniensis]|uniref:Uncharacterized protein n=1 Tax=Leptospira bouyouniensis TaxID=2484911 RepID=A0A7I0HRV7_9LEPT|nr:hypothetical protein EHQ43_10050 [Leptospira bouyouniensis]